MGGGEGGPIIADLSHDASRALTHLLTAISQTAFHGPLLTHLPVRVQSRDCPGD